MASEANGSDRGGEEGDLGEHRAFVREVHKKLATAYGLGGGAVVVAVVGIATYGWFAGMLTAPLLWLGAITVALVGLFVVRTFVYRRADRLWERVQAYCDANEVEPEALRDHFGSDDLYQFFGALIELQQRRERMRRGELPEADESG